MNKEVDGKCSDCPLWNWDYYKCNHPAAEDEEEWWNYSNSIPDWCPLKKEPITISIKS